MPWEASHPICAQTPEASLPDPYFVNKDIQQIIADLYDGTLDEGAWRRGILGVCDLVGGSGALLLALSTSRGQILQEQNFRLDPEGVVSYSNHWGAQDMRVGPAMRIPAGTPMLDHQLVSLDELRRSAFYNDFLLPYDSPHNMAVWLHKSEQRVVALTFQATHKRGAFGVREAGTVATLVPHMSRALAIKDRLQQLQISVESLTSALDRSPCALMMLDATGKVIERNGAAMALMRGNPDVRVDLDGHLWLREPTGRALDGWILAGVPAGDRHGVFQVPRPYSQPLSIVAVPLSVTALSWSTETPRWLLMLFDPERTREYCAAQIAQHLQISNREAELVALLAAGLSLATAAQRLGITTLTARAHLKRIFSRTDVRSQAELVRKVALDPLLVQTAWPQPT